MLVGFCLVLMLCQVSTFTFLFQVLPWNDAESEINVFVNFC